jgi:hypothetical protein
MTDTILPQNHRHDDPANPLARVRPLGRECLHYLVQIFSRFTNIVNPTKRVLHGPQEGNHQTD